jgi:hypothetical protein
MILGERIGQFAVTAIILVYASQPESETRTKFAAGRSV